MSRFSEYLTDLKERGARFLDRLGRGRRASAHVRTILGDSVVDTYNGAQLIRGRVLGSPGAEVHDALLGDTDDACETADGQLWSLTHALANKKEHPNCLIAGQTVWGPRVLRGYDRRYVGEVVKIETVGGRVLSCTPQHPVLTPKGWVAAASLDEGDHLICHGGTEGVSVDVIDPDDYQIPALIEDIACSSTGDASVFTEVMEVAAEDFHGDGIGSEVCVVRSDSLLGDGGDTALGEPPGHSDFERRDAEAAFLAGAGTQHLGIERVGATSGGGVGGGGLGSAFDGGALAVTQQRVLRASPDGDTRPEHLGAERVAVHPDLVSEVSEGFPGEVTVDEVVEVRDGLSFAGHVYNLQTDRGWYVANGIVTQNCTREFTLMAPGDQRELERVSP